MWQDLTEIDEIFNRHDYDTTNIITNMFHQFKLKIAFKQYGVQKQQGFFIIDDSALVKTGLCIKKLSYFLTMFKKDFARV